MLLTNQAVTTCSKSTIETPEQCLKSAQIWRYQERYIRTYFSGYKRIKLHEKAMLYVLNQDFAFLLIEILQNFVEVFIFHWLR